MSPEHIRAERVATGGISARRRIGSRQDLLAGFQGRGLVVLENRGVGEPDERGGAHERAGGRKRVGLAAVNFRRTGLALDIIGLARADAGKSIGREQLDQPLGKLQLLRLHLLPTRVRERVVRVEIVPAPAGAVVDRAQELRGGRDFLSRCRPGQGQNRIRLVPDQQDFRLLRVGAGQLFQQLFDLCPARGVEVAVLGIVERTAQVHEERPVARLRPGLFEQNGEERVAVGVRLGRVAVRILQVAAVVGRGVMAEQPRENRPLLVERPRGLLQLDQLRGQGGGGQALFVEGDDLLLQSQGFRRGRGRLGEQDSAQPDNQYRSQQTSCPHRSFLLVSVIPFDRNRVAAFKLPERRRHPRQARR